MSAIVTSLTAGQLAALPPVPTITPDAFATPSAVELRQLHICPACAADTVVPHDWVELNRESWHMRLECAECDWRDADFYSAAEVELFETHLAARG